MRVLVVEDDSFAQMALGMMLDQISAGGANATPISMEVTMVDSAEEAIKLLCSSKIDLALVDITLPGANGCELTTSFSERFAESGIVFVACSGDIDPDDEQQLKRLRAAGMSDVLKKPVRAPELRATLNKWMPRNAPTDAMLRTPTGGLLRACYIEDCSIQATAGKFLLEQLGVRVDVAETGAQGLQLLCSTRAYHLVIIDLVLPDMSGYAVCSAYLQHCNEQGVPTALTLAVTAESDDAPCTDFGFARRLTKPLSSAVVVELLRTWLASPGALALDEATLSLGAMSLAR